MPKKITKKAKEPKIVQISENEQIFLPRTLEEFDSLVDSLVEMYSLPDKRHAAVQLAVRITHMPPEQATTTRKYLGHCIIKNLAYNIAEHKRKQMSFEAHEEYVAQLATELTSDPMNGQARDQLEKFAREGSVKAKEVLAMITPPTSDENVIAIN